MERLKQMLGKLGRFANSWTGTIIIVLLLIFFVIQSFVIPSGSMKKTQLVGDFLFAKKFSYGIPTPSFNIPLTTIKIPFFPDIWGNGHLVEGERPKRGDIVIFFYPKNTNIHYVKRCVAIGGDEVIYAHKKFLIHFHEGDAYIKANYPKEKIVSLRGKLWVENPYMEQYPGIGYEQGERNSVNNIFGTLMHFKIHGLEEVDMSPVFLEDPTLPKAVYKGQIVNALYKKVESDHFYMMGDNRDNSEDSRFWGAVPYKYVIGKPWFVYFSWDSDKKEVRWDRVGRFIDDMQLEAPRESKE